MNKTMLIFRCWLLFFALGLMPTVSLAMNFRIFYQPDLKINIVIGEGEIIEGDNNRFLEIAKQADRDSEGHVIFVLDSLGGSVRAAFELVEAMDTIGVFTLVPDNALCASSCASIVYISGTRRNVIGTGRLGFHSCYRVIDSESIEDSICNHLIAKNAFLRGLSYASVDLFVKDYGADKIAWVGRDVACTMLPGMCKPTLKQSVGKTKISPSFDCQKASTAVEKLICDDEGLSLLDKKMAGLYSIGLKKQDFSQSFRNGQRIWIRDYRNKCRDKECLISTYNKRIAALLP